MSGFQKLEHEHDKQTDRQTDGQTETERITMSHSRVLMIAQYRCFRYVDSKV